MMSHLLDLRKYERNKKILSSRIDSDKPEKRIVSNIFSELVLNKLVEEMVSLTEEKLWPFLEVEVENDEAKQVFLSDLRKELREFLQCSAFGADQVVKNNKLNDGSVYWDWAGINTQRFKSLKEMASHLLYIVVQTATCERLFSSFKRIQTLSRANMSNDKLCITGSVKACLKYADKIGKATTMSRTRLVLDETQPLDILPSTDLVFDALPVSDAAKRSCPELVQKIQSKQRVTSEEEDNRAFGHGEGNTTVIENEETSVCCDFTNFSKISIQFEVSPETEHLVSRNEGELKQKAAKALTSNKPNARVQCATILDKGANEMMNATYKLDAQNVANRNYMKKLEKMVQNMFP